MHYAWADDGINKLWGICKLMRYVNAVVLEIEWNDKKRCVMYTLLCWKLTKKKKKLRVMYTLLCWKLNEMTRNVALCTRYCVGNWQKSYAFCTRYCVGNWMKWQEALRYVHATVLEIDKKCYAFCTRYCVGNWMKWQEVLRYVHATVGNWQKCYAFYTHYCVGNWMKWQEVLRYVHATVLEIDKKVMRFVHATVLEIEWNDKKRCVMYTLLCWKLTKMLCVLYTLLCWKFNEMTNSDALCTRCCVGNWIKLQKVMRSVHAVVLEIEWNDKKWCIMYTLLCWKLNKTTKSDALCTRYCVGNWIKRQKVMHYVHAIVLEIE